MYELLCLTRSNSNKNKKLVVVPICKKIIRKDKSNFFKVKHIVTEVLNGFFSINYRFPKLM